MNFKKWRIGLLVSLLSGLFTGVIGWGMDMTVKQIVFFTIIAIAKDGWLYLTKHPVDAVSFETSRITRDDAQGVTTTQSSKTTVSMPGAEARPPGQG